MTRSAIPSTPARAACAACSLALAASAAPGADAGDAGAGERKAQPCLSCHDVQNFAGLGAGQLAAAIAELGERGHFPLPPTLTAQDMADIAAYLATSTAATE